MKMEDTEEQREGKKKTCKYSYQTGKKTNMCKVSIMAGMM